MTPPHAERETEPRPVDVAIVGGGIAGLALAYRLGQARPDLTVALLEASERLGGKLLTETIDHAGGRFLIEAGPDAFLAQKPWARDLAIELGLADRMIPVARVPQPVSVLRHGQLVPLPAGVSLMAPTAVRPFVETRLISLRGKVRMGLEPLLPVRNEEGDESLASFVRRRLGGEALDWIAEPLMAGIYNASPEEISLLATFPQFREAERKHGSVIRGLRRTRTAGSGNGDRPSPFLTFQGGMQELVDALAARMAGSARVETPVERLAPLPDGTYRLELADGRQVGAGRVVLALPAAMAADLLAPFAPRASALLRQLRTSSSGNVVLAYRSEAVRRPLKGYGLVVPRREAGPFNALTVVSRKFAGRAPEGWTLLRLFFGGARTPETLDASDDQVVTQAQMWLRDLLELEGAPALTRVYRWPAGSPIYEVGHLDRIAAIEATLPDGVWLLGSPYRGVGIPDIVRNANDLANRLIREPVEQEMAAPSAA